MPEASPMAMRGDWLRGGAWIARWASVTWGESIKNICRKIPIMFGKAPSGDAGLALLGRRSPSSICSVGKEVSDEATRYVGMPVGVAGWAECL